jgi:low temperature requirement protein LtrA
MKVLRERSGDAAPRVTHMELFFDRVYVLAITQLSDFLFLHRSPRGALEAPILFLAVW